MTLHRVEFDGPDAPPLFLVHGLFGSARNWRAIAKKMAQKRPVVTLDLRNHANSPWFDSHTYADLAEDLAAEVPQGADVLGHSMGGKAAMVLALRHPNRLRKLIVADIAPVAYTHSQMPMIEAMRGINLDLIEHRKDAQDQMAELVDDPAVASFLLQSLDVADKSWRLNLDVLARFMPDIVGFPDVDGAFEGPAFFLSGKESDYVLSDHRAKIRRLFPNSVFARIPGAGHWLHAEKPREFILSAETFLDA